jgi:hypothetical protein
MWKVLVVEADGDIIAHTYAENRYEAKKAAKYWKEQSDTICVFIFKEWESVN